MTQDDFYRGDPPPGHQLPSGHGYPPPSGPGYPPPTGQGYGPPPGYGYPPPAYVFARRPTNTTAIVSLVFAFLFPPVGIVLGVMARNQIRRTGEEGDGLALAGVIVGSIATGLYALLIVFWVVAFASLIGSI